jgi:hypothetical protein
MKKNNGGTPEQVSRAMGRLEIAFTSVKSTVGADGETAPAEAVEAPELPGAPATPEPTTPEPTTPEVHQTPQVSEPIEQPAEEPVLSGFASVHETHVEESESVPEPLPVPPVSAPDSTLAAPEQEPTKPEEASPETIPDSMESKPQVSATGGIMSVAKEKQIQDLMTTEKQQAAMSDQQHEAIKIAAMDPLMTPEVTNGLQQLLSEWSLFKSSGIFGTGPSGVDHQLYKKLADLSMTAVVAGRFEGATPEIKRSITDYMNGWRYEEGVLQEHGELFEHYLRRVIKHILDKRIK